MLFLIALATGMAFDRRDLLKRLTAFGATGLGAAIAGCSSGGTGSTPTEMGEESTPAGTETPTATPTPTEMDPTTNDTPTEPETTSTGTGQPALTVETHPEYGDVLADEAGRTLYLFQRDPAGESTCYDDCASAWPPLTVDDGSTPEGGSDVTADLGTIERDDGGRQVTADDRPLYYFANDQESGDAKGMGVFNAWFLLRPNGSSLQPTVSMAPHDAYGEILTDAAGRTLYMFEPDEDGESTCYDDCARLWPPLTVENDDAVDPAATISAPLGTTERDDGTIQVTANGMPLYYYAPDEEPGDATGQGVGDVWFVLRPDGSVVTGTQ
jgi:predicted lipoprotein with Yx(FWY)xxD motif